MKESSKINGVFQIKCVNKSGRILWAKETKNLIVNDGRESMATALSGGSNSPIESIAVGTNGAAAELENDVITNPFSKAFESISLVGKSVVCSYIIDFAEANEKDIREFGILLESADLFARVAVPLIQKTDALKLEGTWTINF